MRELRLADRAFGQIYQEQLRSLKRPLTEAQYQTLSVLDDGGKLCQAEIIKLSGIDRSTISDMLRRMRKSGLVEQEHGDDARINYVSLTAQGRAALRQMRDAYEKAIHIFLGPLTTTERKNLAAILPKLQTLKSPNRRKGQADGTASQL